MAFLLGMEAPYLQSGRMHDGISYQREFSIVRWIMIGRRWVNG